MECVYDRIHATVCERDVNREVIERDLEVDAMPEVEQKKKHLVEDPADDETNSDRDHRLEYALASAFFDALSAMSGVDFAAICGGGRGTRSGSRRCGAEWVDFGAQPDGHQNVGVDKYGEWDKELHE